jgi:Zn finger protein HypA/HybF involved in hydrogenase expression
MKTEKIICKNCESEHLVQNKYSCKSLFCSIQCQQDYILIERVLGGTAKPKTLKRFLIKEHGNKCWTCGITEWNNKSIVMELEHIDGNSENNSLDNLSLICPNCHSQTPTYKGKNRGSGRHSRRLRYAEGKSY